MNIQPIALRRQRGVALLVLLTLLLLASAAILLDQLNGEANTSAASDKANGEALAEAKAALIAWSATYPPSAARESTAGTLPYPDRNGDGDYDGMADCDALGASDLVLVGRLPRLGEDSLSVANCGVDNPLNVDLTDGAGEALWYAVSRNVLPGVGVAGGPINPDMGGAGRMTYPWIQLRDDQGNVIMDPNAIPARPLAVAAVIFAAGPVVGGQDRSGVAAPANYLDSVGILGTTYDNADVDGCPDSLTAPCAGSELEEFVVYPNPQSADVFNDKLVYITVDDLTRAVEKRVLGETALVLDAYRTAFGAYPWLADFRGPRAVSQGVASGGSSTFMDDLLPVPANFLAEDIRIGDTIVNEDTGGRGFITAVTATRISFNALEGGSDAQFDNGEAYSVEAAFKSEVTSGAADAGSLTHLDEAAGNFVARGVRPGNFIANTDDVSSGLITAVTATRIDFGAGLAGGVENDFDPGEHFMVLSRVGQLPVHRSNEIFKTGFTIKWNFVDIHEIDNDSGGAAALVPITNTENLLSDWVMSEDGFDDGTDPAPVVIGPDEGYCRWTAESRVDCYGRTVDPSFVRKDLLGTPTVQRTIEVNIGFDASGTDPSDPAPFVSLPAVVVNPPTATSPRTRDLSISSAFLGTMIPLPPGGLAPDLTLAASGIIKTTDTLTIAWAPLLAGDWASRELILQNGIAGPNHGDGVITVSGIRYDLSVVYDDVDDAKDELPEWFAENDWHHFIFAAFSSDVVSGGDGNCLLPLPSTCLTLNAAGTAAQTDIGALLLSSGVEWTNQDRDIGDCDGDGGGPLADPTDDSFLCAYFDGNTTLYDVSADVLRHGANTGTDTITADFYARDIFSAGFNDQIRIVDPLPP